MKARKVPERMCISCRQMKPKKSLIRVVRSPDGTVSVDAGGKASGRGAYVCAAYECVNNAEKRRGVEKNLDIADCAALYQKLREICENAEGRANSAEGRANNAEGRVNNDEKRKSGAAGKTENGEL